MNTRPIMAIGIFLVAAVVCFYAGYQFRAAEQSRLAHGRPYVRMDLGTDELVQLGFSFARPPGATNVVVAAVGNGVGDSAVYLSFDLPPAMAAPFFEHLRTDQLYTPARAPRHHPYLQQLAPAVAATLWPQSGFEEAQVLQGGKVLVAYLPGTARIHALCL